MNAPMMGHSDPRDGAARARKLRPGREDFRQMFALAIPVVVVQLGMMTMGVVDTILVGHVSAADLAATALGNLYVFGTSAFALGTLMALDPVVAQAWGAREEANVARAVQRGLVMCAVLAVPLSLVCVPAGSVLAFLGQPDAVVPLSRGYVHVSIFGLLPFYAFIVLRQSLTAMSLMRPIVITIIAANVFNLVLSWLLVFGHLGEQYRGSLGAGIATSIARWVMALLLIALAWRQLKTVLLPVRRQAFLLAPLGRMFRLGAPIGAQFVLEFGIFGTVALLMGRLGTVPVAAHQVAINIASLMFMVPLGISSAAAVLVGQAVGAGDADRARRAAMTTLAAGATAMALSGTLLIAAPGILAHVYSTDAAVVGMAIVLIPIAGLFQVFDGLQVVAIGVLRGVGDTRAPMIVNVVGFWLVGLPVSLWLGFSAGFGPRGLWWGLVVGLAAVAVILLLRVWQRMSRELERVVIEEEA